MTQALSQFKCNTLRCIAMSIFMFCFVIATQLHAQVSSSDKAIKTVGVGGDFLKISDALDSLNAGGFNTGLILTLLDSSYNEPPLEINRVSPIPYLLIKPAIGKKPIVHISSSTAADSIGFLISQTESVIMYDITFVLEQSSFWKNAMKITASPSDISFDTITIQCNNVPMGIVVSPDGDDSVSFRMRNCSIAGVGGGISISGFTSFELKKSTINHNNTAAIELFSNGGSIEIKNNICFGNEFAIGGMRGNLSTAFCLIDSNSITGYENYGVSFDGIYYPESKRNNNKADFGEVFIRNNTISYLIEGGGIMIDTAEYVALNISGNSIVTQFGSPHGIFVGENYYSPFMAVNRNTISNVSNGIEFGYMEVTLDGDAPGTLMIDSNEIHCAKNAIKFDDYVFANIEIERNNLTNAGTLPTMLQARDKKVITYGVYLIDVDGNFSIRNNTMQNFFCCISLNSVNNTDYGSDATISANSMNNTNIGIIVDDEITHDTVKITDNTIAGPLEGSGINIIGISGNSLASIVEISNNSILGTNPAIIGYAGIYIEYINSNNCQINNNTINSKLNSGIIIGSFDGMNWKEKTHSKKQTVLKNSRVKLPRTSLDEDFTAQFSVSNNTVTHHASLDGEEGAIILGNIELCNVTVSKNTTTSDGISVNGIKFNELYIGNFALDSNIVSQTEIGIDNLEAFFYGKLSISFNNIHCTTRGLSQAWGDGKLASIRGNVVEPYLNNPNYYPERGMSIGISADTCIIEENTAKNFETGIRIYSHTFYTSIYANIATHNETGMTLFLFSRNIVNGNAAISRFENNTISDNSDIGLHIEEMDYSLPLFIRFNRFFRNANDGILIQYTDNVQPIIHSNAFGENGVFDIRNESENEIIAEHNRWGATTTAEMDATPYPGNISTLFDTFDDSTRGFIRYNHWLHDTNYVPAGTIIQGTMYHDRDADSSIINDDEIGERKIMLTGTYTDSVNTNSHGNYFFYDVPPGEYAITHQLDSLWFLSYPATQQYQLTLDTAEFAFHNDFGIFTYGQMSGYLFHDINANGVRDNNEPFLINRKVYLGGLKQDSIFTDSAGVFAFRNLFPGNYFVCTLIGSGIATTNDTLFTKLHSDEINYSMNFGIAEYSSISGVFYNDRDSNGIRDPNEEGLANWRLILSIGTRRDTVYSDSTGFYDFDSLQNGQYRVTGELKQSWRRTVPITGYYVVNVSPNVSNANKNFGVFQRPADVKENDVPLTFSLQQNYPNPFNPTTSIAYSIAKQTFVSLKIFNILGEDIATLVNKEQDAGKYTVEWDARSVASGLYFYRLQAGNFVAVKKLVIQK